MASGKSASGVDRVAQAAVARIAIFVNRKQAFGTITGEAPKFGAHVNRRDQGSDFADL